MNLKNLNNKKITPIIHGENGLIPVKAFRGGWKDEKEYIVGHSETGHHHVITGNVATLEKDGKRYLLVKEVSKLWHQKSFDVHETIEVQPATYEITHKTEYDPFEQVMRNVWD